MDDGEEFVEPPEGFWTTPKHQLMAHLDGSDEAARAIIELVTAGFPRDGIYVLVGKEAADMIDPTGEKSRTARPGRPTDSGVDVHGRQHH